MAIFEKKTGTDNPFDSVDVGSSSAPSFVDVDGDGDLDAFIGEWNGNLNFYRNDTGTFTSVTGTDNPFNGVDVLRSSKPSFTDVDGDGDLDAFIGEGDGNLNFYRNEGGSFTEVTGADNPFNGVNVGRYSTPSFADLDGDGDLDALIGEGDGNLNFYRNEGGTFTEVTGADNPFDGVDVGSHSTPSFADLDGDGDLDALIGAGGEGGVMGVVYYRNDSGTFTEVTGADNPFNGLNVGGFSAPSFADVDGDGDLDVSIGLSGGTIEFYENTAPVATIAPGTIPSEVGTTATTGTFIVTLSDAAPAGGITISYTVGGTATSGTDYTALSGSVTVAAGATTATIDVTPILDTVTDPGETVEVTLTGTPTSNYNLGDTATAVLRIADETPTTFTEVTGADNPFNSVNVGRYSHPSFADLDGDGDLDASIGAQNGNLIFYRNDSGTFTEVTGADNPFHGLDVGDDSAPSFADLDGDGDLDALIGQRGGNLIFYRNDSGTFTAVIGAENPFDGVDVGNRSVPNFADLDGDADLDAFIGEGDGTLNFYRNDSGTFTEVIGPENPFNGINVGLYSTPSFADVDGDGDLDAFIGEFDGNLNFYRNEGGTFTEVTGADNPFNGVDVGFFSSPSFADLDGDGDLDAFIGEAFGTLKFYENAPTATITAGITPSEVGTTATTGTFIVTLTEAAPAGGITIPYTVGGTATSGSDYTALSGTVTVAAGATTASIDVTPILDAVTDPGETVEVTLTDGATYNLGDTATAVLGIADETPTTFTERTGTDNPFDSVDVGSTSHPAFTDLDGDGDLDVFVGAWDGNIYYYRNEGSSFSAFSPTDADNPFNGVDVGNGSKPSFADIDGDGDLDAFLGEQDGTINYYRNDGTSTSPSFTEVTGTGNPLNGIDVGLTSHPSFADIDGDGDVDAFIGKRNNGIHYYRNDGTSANPSFTEVTGTDNPLDGINFSFSRPNFADLDGDGDLDLLLGEGAEGGQIVRYYRNDGGNFTAATGGDNPLDGVDVGSYSSPSFADIDGDGDLDALIGEGNGTLNFYENAPTATITAGITPTEDGTTGTFTFTLSDPAPDSGIVLDYTVAGTATSGTDYTALSRTVTVAAGETTATVNVAAIDDLTVDPGETVSVTLTDGAAYNLGTTTTAELTITDNDAAGFTLSKTTATVDESGSTDSFTVVLSSQPTSNVVILVSSDDTGEATATPTPLTFTPANWDTAQTVTVTGVDDHLDDGNQTSTVTLEIDDANSDDNFDTLGNQTVTVTTNDDDTAGVTIGTTNVNATEGGATGSYTVVLDAEPTDDVTVSFTTDSEVEVIGALTFTPANWDTPQTVTVTATDETNIDGTTTSTISHSTSGGGYDGVTIEDVTATIVDNDSPNVAIAESDGNTQVEEDGTADRYELSLTSTPSGDVTITVTAAAGVEVSGDNTSFGSTADVLFTNANGLNPLTVYVRAIDDDDAEGTLSGSITHAITASDDTNYPTTLDIGSVIPTITDNDIAYELSLDTSRLDEGNSGSQTLDFTITRSGAIDEMSTVDFTLSGTASDGSDYNNPIVSGTDISEADGTITFEAGSQTAIVSVEILGDAIAEPDETLILTLDNATASGTATLTTDSLTASILNDDTAGVTLSTTTLDLAEGGTTADYTVRLTSQPTGVVTLGFNTGTQLEAIADIEFAPTNWNIPQTVTVAAIDDLDIEGEHSGSISHTLVGGGYDGISIGEIAVTIADNDIAEIEEEVSPPETPISNDSTPIEETQTPTTTPTSTQTETEQIPPSSTAPEPLVESIESDLCHLVTNPPSFPNLNPTTNTLTGTSLIGDDNDNTLDGTGETQVTIMAWHGNDNLLGSSGDDRMFGNQGTDVIDAGMGNDAVFAGQGDDAARGGLGTDLIAGDFGNDRLWGNEDSDVIFGNAGNDYINGGVGNDLIFAGKDNDAIVGGDGADVIAGEMGSDCLHGQAGNDILFGNAENDVLDGGEGNDLLFGGRDNDTLLGGLGSDLLFGDLGNDLLSGGAGGDRFDFRFGDGSDIITDFEDGIDLIGLQGGLTFTDLAIAQVGNDTQITATGLVITLQGVNVGAIDSADFALV